MPDDAPWWSQLHSSTLRCYLSFLLSTSTSHDAWYWPIGLVFAGHLSAPYLDVTCAVQHHHHASLRVAALVDKSLNCAVAFLKISSRLITFGTHYLPFSHCRCISSIIFSCASNLRWIWLINASRPARSAAIFFRSCFLACFFNAIQNIETFLENHTPCL